MKPVNKIHPIINERYPLFNYNEYSNIIQEGQYSYPFTLNLPEWLPQSVLCFNTPDPKKPMLLNTLKIRYNLIAVIEGTPEADEGAGQEAPQLQRRATIIKTQKKGVTLMEMQNMMAMRRITIITPEFSQPLLNQEIKIQSKIKAMGLMGAGSCEYTCKFEKDVLYPNETIKLEVFIDNSKCSKKIEKYKIKLLKRTQVFNLKTTKPIYTNDFILQSEKLDGNCDAKSTETKTFEFRIPTSIFTTDSEENRIKIPLPEKPLAQGPTSSISARLFKV